ncbi:hypothetical protein COLO4_35419 [Corchorus olitorius]|uniref:Uncharacterized protein n=1 Tax=Corchorus olitorius TaxID=93759 RepID=A0A1R3GGY8_9ROSI|nr:hypothetical protein COLO4_35419 [Corchorus olitorius]
MKNIYEAFQYPSLGDKSQSLMSCQEMVTWQPTCPLLA